MPTVPHPCVMPPLGSDAQDNDRVPKERLRIAMGENLWWRVKIQFSTHPHAP